MPSSADDGVASARGTTTDCPDLGLDVPAYRAELIAESLWEFITKTAACRRVWVVKTASISPAGAVLRR